MYKISIKSENPASAEYQQAYAMMRDIFFELVFCGNCEGYAPAGTEFIILQCEAESIKDVAEEIWRDNRDYDDPDNLLKIEWVDTIYEKKDRGEYMGVEMNFDEILTCSASLLDYEDRLKNTARDLADRRRHKASETLLESAKKASNIRSRLEQYIFSMAQK